MDQAQQNVVNATNLVKSFAEVRAVDDISLHIAAGECLALLGPNGAGKTTTCEMLEGLLEPDSGQIEILGMNPKTDRNRIMQKVGIQLQETMLYGRYTVRETLELFASFYQHSRDLSELLKEIDLVAEQDRYIKQLSGGQKQRVYLGCCLVNDPEVVFLDEPTTGLDPQSRRAIWSSIEQLKGRQKAVLLTTHYMDEAHKLADQVCIMNQGKIVARGTPEELIRQHCAEEVLTFSLENIASRESRDAIFKRIESQLPWLRGRWMEEDRICVTIDHPADRITELVESLSTEKQRLTELHVRQSSLEDVFIVLTGRSISDVHA